jgi:hypothetical protein
VLIRAQVIDPELFRPRPLACWFAVEEQHIRFDTLCVKNAGWQTKQGMNISLLYPSMRDRRADHDRESQQTLKPAQQRSLYDDGWRWRYRRRSRHRLRARLFACQLGFHFRRQLAISYRDPRLTGRYAGHLPWRCLRWCLSHGFGWKPSANLHLVLLTAPVRRQLVRAPCSENWRLTRSPSTYAD